jgi:archaellum component FlaC
VIRDALRTALRLPDLVQQAAEAATDTSERLASIQRVVSARLAALDQGIRDVISELPAITDDLRRVRASVEPQQAQVADIDETLARLEAQVAEMHMTLAQVKASVDDVVEHLPGSDSPGPLARAREALAGGS